MLKKLFWLAVVTVVFTLQALVPSVGATELTKEIRTVPLNPAGDTITLSLKQVKEGKRLFNYACAQCHAGGVTKTDPNVGLDPEALELATPKRNSVEALVSYMKDPTSYDGALSIAEAHPSLKSKDIFPVMRNLNEEDLVAIAGHVLMQPKVVGDKWGGGKIYY
ncbi:MAG: cytochrome c-550 [Alkalinema sp. RU_4_3]|nr:cytochrome c-550 [Alkalinema sp. RU_4_3]